MLNIELIDKTVKFAEENERLHDQSVYFSNADENPVCTIAPDVDSTIEKLIEQENECGSAGCIACWGSLFAGWCQVRITYRPWEYESMTPEQRIEATEDRPTDDVVNPADGEVLAMADAAQREFGLNDSQANAMFDGANTISDIRDMVEALRGNPNADLRPMTTSQKYLLSTADDNCDCDMCRSEQ